MLVSARCEIWHELNSLREIHRCLNIPLTHLLTFDSGELKSIRNFVAAEKIGQCFLFCQYLLV